MSLWGSIINKIFRQFYQDKPNLEFYQIDQVPEFKYVICTVLFHFISNKNFELHTYEIVFHEVARILIELDSRNFLVNYLFGFDGVALQQRPQYRQWTGPMQSGKTENKIKISDYYWREIAVANLQELKI